MTEGTETIADVVGFQPVDGLTPLVVITREIALGTCAASARPPAAEPAEAEPAFWG